MSFLLPFWITSSNFYFPFRILFYRIKFCCVRTNFCLPSQILMFRFTRNSVLSWGTSTTTCNFFRIHINFYDQIICFQFMAHRVPNRSSKFFSVINIPRRSILSRLPLTTNARVSSVDLRNFRLFWRRMWTQSSYHETNLFVSSTSVENNVQR